ncbi:MAG TPA: hypothetical protein DCQ06_02750, partial [Myxococcales bacterium]|nr:hypothetical protein [Myxococcales bacterium]
MNYNNGTNYVTSAVGAQKRYADSPVISLKGAKKPQATFYYRGNWETGTYDDFKVYVVADGSASMAYNLNASTTWEKRVIPLTKWLDKDIKIRFEFATSDNFQNQFAGAFVDDLSVVDLACTGDKDCDDGNACSLDKCSNGTCVFAN